MVSGEGFVSAVSDEEVSAKNTWRLLLDTVLAIHSFFENLENYRCLQKKKE